MRTELVTTLKRRASEIIEKLGRDQETVLITQDGRPAAYLIDVETYDSATARLALLEGTARGERAVEEGRIVSHSGAKKRMGRWLK